MLKYLIKRILYMVLTLFVITTATFFLMHNIQGDPLSAMGKTLPEQTIKITKQDTVWINQYQHNMQYF